MSEHEHNAELRVSLLGGFRVAVAGEELPESAWRRRKAAGLVKLLALAGEHRLHREAVLEQLWPELALAAAENNLHRTLHVARRILEPTLAAGQTARYLRLTGDVLTLGAPGAYWIDVDAFEAGAALARQTKDAATYSRVLDLYTGDLLPEDLYEDWSAGRRESLRALCLTLLMELGRLHAGAGRHGEALAPLERLVALEPAHEAARSALMRLYAGLNRRQEALAQYSQLEAALRRDYDAEPSAALQQLHTSLLATPRPAPRPTDRQPASAERAPPARETVPGAGLTPLPSALPAVTALPTSVTPPAPAAAAGAAPRRTNVPRSLTSFIGREREQAELRALLGEARLLTLTGAGGSGKTRLALEVAAGVVRDWPDGVWVIELAPVADPALVEQTVAGVLGVREAGGAALDQSLTAALVEQLRGQRTLLLFDNCEHVLDPCAALAEALLRGCPGVQVLATSREPLGIAGEMTWRVPPLALPSPAAVKAPPEQLGEHDAVRLFLVRARSAKPSFVLTGQNAPAVVQICTRLDGIPLAIELAASRVRVLTPEGIAARLDDALAVLGSGSRSALPRQQTLRATIEWSYQLLTDSERLLLRRLAVFAGGWTLDAAEAVVPDEAGALDRRDVLPMLAQLVEKSLVTVETDDTDSVGSTEARYSLLETVRQYSAERLREAGEAGAVAARHAGEALALAERTADRLLTAEQAFWSAWMERDHDNLRAALRWAIDGQHAETAHRLAAALFRFWELAGHLTEGRRWLHLVLEMPTDTSPELQSRVRNSAANLAHTQGDHATASALQEQNLALLRATPGGPRRLASTLNNLGVVVRDQGDLTRATALFEESLQLARQLEDHQLVAMTLLNLSRTARAVGDLDAAVRYGAESLRLFTEVGNYRGSASASHSLGMVALDRGDLVTARACNERGLADNRAAGDKRGVALLLADLARTRLRAGDRAAANALTEECLPLFRELGNRVDLAATFELVATLAADTAAADAARLLGAAAGIRTATGIPRLHTEQATYDAREAALIAALTPAAYRTAQTAGQDLTLAAAIDLAEQVTRGASPQTSPVGHANR